MSGAGEVGKSLFEGKRVRGLNQHKRHGRPEKNNMCILVLGKIFPFEKPIAVKWQYLRSPTGFHFARRTLPRML